ncbi:MAG: HAD family hydrolase [Woeseiaceae bacterium]|nr:HAD family hydrolase [Woeseiaceae bacterium]
MHRIRAVSLDLDDTLWAVGPVIRRAERELWHWLGQRYPRIVERYSPDDALELRREAAARHPEKAHDFRYLRRATLARMAVAAGYDEALASEAFDVFDRWRNRVDLYPDVEPALGRLQARFVLIAVTNGNASLDRIGIGRYFHDVVAAAAVGHAKPSRAIYDAAVERSGVAADAVLHVGDHPELDVRAAARAGLKTAWINRGDDVWPEAIAPPDAVIRDLADLDELLAANPAEDSSGTGP